MHIIRHFENIPQALKGAVIAIGNFDGVHIGHRALIEEGKAIAKAANKPFAILTFEPHPRRIFQPESPHIRLTSFAEKAALLKKLGVDAIFVQRFTPAFSALSAEQFIEHILVKKLGASHVITGAEFVFGQARKGNSGLLLEYSSRGVFGYTAYAPKQSAGQKISSTQIRTLLSMGDCSGASALLTRPFSLTGRVNHGDKRGRTLGFPTANIALYNRFLPKFGVYAVKISIDGSELSKPIIGSSDHRIITFIGVANLGIRPMYDTKAPLLEVHLFDFSGDIYGAKMMIECCDYIRPEQNFSSEKELIDAMNNDTKQAKQFFNINDV